MRVMDNQMILADLQLAPLAYAGAKSLVEEFGEAVHFTSGYRSLWDQARAMAANVAKKRTWIGETYVRKERPSYQIAQTLQQWIDTHPTLITVAALSTDIYSQLQQHPFGWNISFHCTRINGLPAAHAFDLTPLENDSDEMTAIGQEVWKRIKKLPGLDAAVTREGGLSIWHVQFRLPDPPMTTEV